MRSSKLDHASLEAELAKLQGQQRDGLERAVYVSMSSDDKREHDARASRIRQIEQLLAKDAT
jgi:hypothetical protein